MRTPVIAALPSALLVLGVAGGCASHPPAPVAELSRAHTLIAQAQSSDAPRYDSADLTSAQDKLQQADSNAQNRPVLAGQMAQEASADAQLAIARTQAKKAQESLGQVNDSLTALRQQNQQLQGDEANGSAGAAPQAPIVPPPVSQGEQP